MLYIEVRSVYILGGKVELSAAMTGYDPCCKNLANQSTYRNNHVLNAYSVTLYPVQISSDNLYLHVNISCMAVGTIHECRKLESC